MKTPILAAACAVAALALTACGKESEYPRGSEVGAAMPDTSAPRQADMRMTAPDAGATGVVPADADVPPKVAETPPVGTAGASPGVIAPTTDQIPKK